MTKIADRYKKALVTVGMGFRTEEDIKKNGLYRFTIDDVYNLIDYVTELFNNNHSVLALIIPETGYRSQHLNINSFDDLHNFLHNILNFFKNNNEIWVVSSSIIECWRCRVYLSNIDHDIIEMAYSTDDHVLDHIVLNSDIPYICYKIKKNKFYIDNINLDTINVQDTNAIVYDILCKYMNIFNKIKNDLAFLNINGISIDIRVNNGYDFHDFDVSYDETKKVIDYFTSRLNFNKTK